MANKLAPISFKARYDYGPQKQWVKTPTRLVGLFNSLIVRLFKTMLFPGASLIKRTIIDFSRIEKARKDLCLLGAEDVTLQTPDKATLNCLYISADRFKKELDQFLFVDEMTDEYGTRIKILRLKKEHYEEQEITQSSGFVCQYRKPKLEAAAFLKRIQNICGSPTPFEQSPDGETREYIINIGTAMTPSASKRDSAATVIITHGSGMTAAGYKGLAGDYLLRGLNVLMVDLRGYGKSSGSPTDFRTKLDLDTAYQYLQTTKNVRNEDLLIHAHCLSGGPASDLAARRPGVSILLDRTFADYTDLAKERFPLIRGLAKRLLPHIVNYNSAKNLQKIRGHIAIQMDTEDSVIPMAQITKLIDHLPHNYRGQKMKLLDSNMDHTGRFPRHTERQFEQFLEQIGFRRDIF